MITAYSTQGFVYANISTVLAVTAGLVPAATGTSPCVAIGDW